jgi:hypothetical protein
MKQKNNAIISNNKHKELNHSNKKVGITCKLLTVWDRKMNKQGTLVRMKIQEICINTIKIKITLHLSVDGSLTPRSTAASTL